MGICQDYREDAQDQVHCDIWYSCPDEYESCEECKRMSAQSDEDDEEAGE